MGGDHRCLAFFALFTSRGSSHHRSLIHEHEPGGRESGVMRCVNTPSTVPGAPARGLLSGAQGTPHRSAGHRACLRAKTEHSKGRAFKNVAKSLSIMGQGCCGWNPDRVKMRRNTARDAAELAAKFTRGAPRAGCVVAVCSTLSNVMPWSMPGSSPPLTLPSFLRLTITEFTRPTCTGSVRRFVGGIHMFQESGSWSFSSGWQLTFISC